MTVCCPVVELRQYTLRPGQREVLIELFDREFVESQEALGMRIIGQFLDLDRPDRFVWLRGFSDMATRKAGLEGFYGGPVWRANSAAANATMLDVDDVLLLRPLNPATGFGEQPPRPRPGEQRPASDIVATICSLDAPVDPGAIERSVLPALTPLAVLVTEPSENTFPALPVRTGEHVLVWVTRGAAEVPHVPGMVGDPVQLRLEPTPRSQLR